MKNSPHSALLGSMVAFSLCAITATRADSSLNCEAYAQVAVAQAFNNHLMKCRNRGRRWSGNYYDHFNWCKGDTIKGVDTSREQQFRIDALKGCAATIKTCKKYAQSAIHEQAMNLGKKCHLTGHRWQLNYENHLWWCFAVSQALRQGETEARRQSIKSCSLVKN